MAIKNKIRLTLITFAPLTVLTIVFIISPVFNQIKTNSEELIIKKEESVALEVKIANLEKFRALYADLEHFLKEINNLFIDPEVPIEFIGFLEKTSAKSQFKVEIVSVSDKKTEEDFWPYLTFRMIATGSFSNFLKFLEKLESSPYLVEIENINVGRLIERNEEIASDDIRVSLSVKVFVK